MTVIVKITQNNSVERIFIVNKLSNVHCRTQLVNSLEYDPCNFSLNTLFVVQYMMYFIDLVPIFYCTQNAASNIGQRQSDCPKLEIEIIEKQLNELFQQFILNYQEAYEVHEQETQDSDENSGYIFTHVITRMHTCMYVYY